MASVKTAISVDESLFRAAERLAGKLKMSRSGLFSRALEEYIRRHRSEDLIQQINEACADAPDREEAQFLRAARRRARRWTEGEEW